jgi:tetratricopeptide (TPR) repeat protein
MMLRQIVLCSLCLLVSNAALAFQFQATEAEWASWPPYCKARYATVRVGKTLGYDRQISPAEIERWQSAVGPDAWYGLHHFCAGMALLDRAKSESNVSRRKNDLQTSLTNYSYMLRNTPVDNPFHAETLARMGLVYEESGEVAEAEAYFARAIEAGPQHPAGYLGMFQFYRDRGESQKALRVLEQADEAMSGQSGEIKYFLGIMNLDLGNKQAALEYAREAYALGYPLPALRDRLAKAGLQL